MPAVRWRLAGHIVLTVLTVGGWPILVLLVRLAQARRR